MFSLIAPAYWQAGLPVIPLRPRQKMPSPNAWQSFASEMPDAATQAAWLGLYADGNIGLPLGPQSGMLALDIDTDDQRVQDIILSLAPHTPWIRKGKKGAVYMFKYNGEKTTRIKGEDGGTLVEILSRGTQVVLPPSIHPDTQMPYVSNAELLDVMDQLVPLPRDYEVLLRQAFIDAGIKLTSRGSQQVVKWVPAGGRDSALVAMAGLLARGVVKGERKLLEALNEIEAWVVNFTENVAGDPLDPKKGRDKIMEFLRRDIVEQGRVLPDGWDFGLADADAITCREFFGEHVEEWTLEQYLDHLEKQFTEVPRENQGARATLVDEVLVRLARSQHMDDMKIDIVLQFIHSGNARLISMASMRKRIKDLNQSVLLGNDHTEIAQALITEVERYGALRFEGSNFFQWAGSHWRQMQDFEILRVLAEEFGSLPAARRHSDHKGILQTVQHLVPRGLVQKEVSGINFANGYLTLDMQLLPHDPIYGARYCMPYRYAPNEGAPLRFLALLDQCWGEREDYDHQIQALREAIAATLFNMAPRFQRAFCLYGLPKSGKSTLMDIVMGLVPPDALCSIPPHDWADRFLPTQMYGKLINFCGELSEKDLIAGDRFKVIVEGAVQSGQFKGKDIFTYRPTCAHWFASNHLPRTRDTSAGFNRRWLILHFETQVTDDQQNKFLAEQILSEELEAIAAWAVPAIEDLLRRQEYTIPQSHKTLISEVASQNNSVRFFLMSGGVTVHAPAGKEASSNRITEKDLYSAYYGFCKITANAVPVQLKRFRMILQELAQEVGFRLRLEHSPQGEEAFYENLTFAGGRKL